MLEEPKIKKVDKRDKQLPQNFEQLIEMYDVEKIWPYIKRTIEYINNDLQRIAVSLTEPSKKETIWFKKGKNLLKPTLVNNNFGGATAEVVDNNIIINGTATTIVGKNIEFDNLEDGVTYTISANTTNVNYIISKMLNGTQGSTLYSLIGANNKYTFTYSKSNDYNGIVIRLVNKVGVTYDNYACNLQIEQGSTATEYEPYIPQPQKMYVCIDGAYEEFISVKDKMSINIKYEGIDLNTINDTEVGTFNTYCTNTPFSDAGGYLYTIKMSNNYMVQIAINAGNGTEYKRIKTGGTWQSWTSR